VRAGAAGEPALRPADSLREALSVLLGVEAATLAVCDGERVVGRLGLNDLRAAVREVGEREREA
jgi:hypothetical protein